MPKLSLPTGRSGKLLALGGTLVAALLIWLAVVAPLLDMYSENAAVLAQRETLYRHMVELSDVLPAMEARAAAGDGAGGSPSAVLSGSSDAVAGAALQQRLQEMAAAEGAVLASTETLPAVPVKMYRRIALRVSIAAPWSVLTGLLQSVERASPRMLVDDLQVRGRTALVQAKEPVLDAGFTVLAFRSDAPAARAP